MLVSTEAEQGSARCCTCPLQSVQSIAQHILLASAGALLSVSVWETFIQRKSLRLLPIRMCTSSLSTPNPVSIADKDRLECCWPDTHQALPVSVHATSHAVNLHQAGLIPPGQQPPCTGPFCFLLVANLSSQKRNHAYTLIDICTDILDRRDPVGFTHHVHHHHLCCSVLNHTHLLLHLHGECSPNCNLATASSLGPPATGPLGWLLRNPTCPCPAAAAPPWP